jgi:hypothetical protein
MGGPEATTFAGSIQFAARVAARAYPSSLRGIHIRHCFWLTNGGSVLAKWWSGS